MTKENIQMGLICAAAIAGIGAIYAYGKTQYYKGRIDCSRDLTREFDRLSKEITEKIWKDKIQKAMAKERGELK